MMFGHWNDDDDDDDDDNGSDHTLFVVESFSHEARGETDSMNDFRSMHAMRYV